MPWPTLRRKFEHQLERIAFGVGDSQILPPLVEQIDGEHRERREPGNQPRNAAQQLIDIEHGRYLAAELEQCGDELVDPVASRAVRQVCNNISPDGTC